MQEQSDFRNGKYQGEMNAQGQRHGLGIFIDDDLTFYISHWKQNRINGLSLIYISHGKYIYGEWKDSEPHGLTVFRSGDTVLVGQCTHGKPSGKCLVIFERFNFACVLQEMGEGWKVLSSGQLATYDTLLQYIDLMGTPVPDHFFSLTKFACHFSKNSAHVKTLPCFSGCCYFGYTNGLALVFNAANGLVSVGAHKEEQVWEFGGRFEGTRWAEEGSFQKNGERVRYSGERPASKIYGIFQKIHKRSLDFHNEYFDSKVKYFTSIEEMLRSQLHLIAKECRDSKQIRQVDLCESLDYQDYTQEESLKINSIRDILYEAPTPSNSHPLEDKPKPPPYFKKPDKNGKEYSEPHPSQTSKQREEPRTPRTVKSKESTVQVPMSQMKRSPIKETSQFVAESRKKTVHAEVQNQKNKYIIREQCPPTPSKLRDRMKTNVCYINAQQNPSYESAYQEKKEKKSILVKTNNIYRQLKIKKDEAVTFMKESLMNSQENSSYRVPNFKCISSNEPSQQMPSPKSRQNPPKQAFMPQLTQPQPSEKTRPSQIQVSPSRKSAAMSKPTYEDMQERRKRILKEYRDLNNPSVVKQAEKPKLPTNQNKFDSPCHLIFSLSKEEQSSFGCMPITISDKPTLRKDIAQNSYNRPFRPEGLHQRHNNAQRTPNRAELKPQKSFKYGDFPGQTIVEQQEIRSKVLTTGGAKPGATPTRVRKNYQYIYE